jgi:glycogen phosphorylase
VELPHLSKPVAFFCNEFAIDNDLPTYAGGLGILAGDLMHQAASDDFPMIGIGILYRGRHYIQHITGDGKEEKRDTEFDHDASFLRPTTLRGKHLEISIPTPTGTVKAKAYHIRLADNTIQFFLSTNIDNNPQEWVGDMDILYGGDIDSQLRQQILLGVGGMRLLNELKIRPSVFHINEGRPAFLVWELANEIAKKQHISYSEAYEQAKQKIVYTNHTLIAAGNPNYHMGAVRYWSEPLANEYGFSVDEMLSSGVVGDEFSITQFAMNSSSKHSAVSKVHGTYAKQQFPERKWIAITNGINLNRWQDSDYRNPNMSDRDLWEQHMIKKRELVDTVIKRTGFGYDPNKLVISWARRLAEYKQPKAIFTDLERLRNIITNSGRPVQLLFAGNSHSADESSKSLIEEVIHLFSTELSGHAIFVPNYNISLGNHLTSGSDVWLNTPRGNLEACGTSGMKAISNGVLNCTVVDGWAYEVNWNEVGWSLDHDNVANDFYHKLENEIIPLYYQRDEEGLPKEWIQRMRKSILLANRFSAERMLQEYNKYLYNLSS